MTQETLSLVAWDADPSLSLAAGAGAAFAAGGIHELPPSIGDDSLCHAMRYVLCRMHTSTQLYVVADLVSCCMWYGRSTASLRTKSRNIADC